MRAKIVKGKILIKLEDPDMESWMHTRAQIMKQIGSAKAIGEFVPEVSCLASPHNLRKLRQMRCKLIRDDETMVAIGKMREERDVYEDENKKGAIAKVSTSPVVDYKFKMPPFDHQVLGFNFLHSMKEPALFGDCGTGKTYIVLTFADSLISSGEKWVLLVVCPVNLIKHVWEEDSKTFTDLECAGLRDGSQPAVRGADWDDPDDPVMNRNQRAALRKERKADDTWKKNAKKRAQDRHENKTKERFSQNVDIYVINTENIRDEKKEKLIKSLLKRKLKEGYKVCLVVDESSKLKSRTSKTYRALKRLRTLCERCIIMTGTPSPHGILDLWAQFSVLDNGKTLQSSFTDYRHEVATEQVLHYVKFKDRRGKDRNATKWIPKPGAAIQVHKTLKPRMIRFRTEDCIDLPPKRFLIRDIVMNAKQASAYADMQKMLFVEIEGEEVTAKIAATKLLKLRQITGGFIRTDDGDDIPLGKTNPKMEELDTLLEQSISDKLGDVGPPSKALVWAQYRWECKALVKRYAKYGARGLFGGISSKAKDNSISRFKSDPDTRVLVCHPGSVGHGLTLVDANYAFYYSLSYNFEEFYQSFRRITRPGQKRSMTFYFLVCPDTIDEELLEVIRARKDLSDIITDGELSQEEFIAKRAKRKSSAIKIEWDVPDEQKEDIATKEGK